MQNTIDQNRLSGIKLILKETGQKQLRVRLNMQGVVTALGIDLLGKIEVVSNGKDIWLEQNKKLMEFNTYPKFYALIPNYMDAFIKKYAKSFVKMSKMQTEAVG